MADSAETGIAVTVGPRTSAARLLNAEYLRFVITANASPALSLMQTALLILILILPLRVEGGRRGEDCTEARQVTQRPSDFSGGVAPYAVDAGNADRLWNIVLKAIQ